MDAPELIVGELGAAEPLPPEFAGELDGPPADGTWSDLAQGEAAADMSDAWIVRKLTPLAKAPFALIALRAGAHWRVTSEEVEPILEAVAQSIPRTPLTEAIVKRSPILAAVLAAGDLITTRLAISEQIAAEARAADGGTDEPVRARVLPFGIGRRAPGPAAGRPDDRPLRQGAVAR